MQESYFVYHIHIHLFVQYNVPYKGNILYITFFVQNTVKIPCFVQHMTFVQYNVFVQKLYFVQTQCFVQHVAFVQTHCVLYKSHILHVVFIRTKQCTVQGL